MSRPKPPPGGDAYGKAEDGPAAERAPIHVKTHRDLRSNIRAICERINAEPEIARRVLVNAVFAFEEAGVVLSEEMRAHVRKSLRWPPRLEAEKKEARAELLREHGEELGRKVPRTPEDRARLLFEQLGVEPLRPEDRKGLDRKRLEAYAASHPLAARLVRYERAARGGLILHTRGNYEKFKSGERRHRWVKAVRFKV